MAAGVQFEVYVHDEDRWVLNSVYDGEPEAIAQARRLLDSGRFHAARVVREATKRTGYVSSQVVFEQEHGGYKPKKRISVRRDIGDGMVCETIDDLFTSSSRALIARVLRDYLEWRGVTPSELLHHHAHAVHLANYESVQYQATSVVAAAQAALAGQDTKSGKAQQERLALLEKLCSQAVQRARKARGGGNIPDLAHVSFADAFADLDSRVDARTRDYLMSAAVSSVLTSGRDWRSKLQLMIGLVQSDLPAAAYGIIDGFTADILRASTALLNLFGEQQGLGTLLGQLARLRCGRYDAEGEASETLTELSRLVGEGRFPDTRKAAGDRILQGLSSQEPLANSGAAGEIAALYKIVTLLRDDSGSPDGPELQAAVEERSTRQAEQECARIAGSGASPANCLDALLDLRDFIFGSESQNIILKTVVGVIDLARAAQNLLDPRDQAVERLRRLGNWQRQAMAFTVTGEVLDDCVRRFDQLAVDILQGERVLDDVEIEADDSACFERLLNLVGSGAITESRAQEMVRAKGWQIVRRAGFLDAWLEGASGGQERESRVRDLWRGMYDLGMR